MKVIHAHYVSNDWVDVVNEASDDISMNTNGEDDLIQEETCIITDNYKGIGEETMVSFPNTPVKPLIFALDLLSSQGVPVVTTVCKNDYTCVDQSEVKGLLEGMTYPKIILSGK